jgi:hypothetical protein
VKKVSGIAAAAVTSSTAIPSGGVKPDGLAGTGRHCSIGATQYSAYAPPATNAQMRSPIFQLPALAPSRSIVQRLRVREYQAPGGGG